MFSATAVRTRELVLAPNLLSLARLPLAALFVLGVAASRTGVALFALVAAAGSDMADGWCARRLKLETTTGRLLDPAADKLFFGAAVVALVAHRRMGPGAALLMGTREMAQFALALSLALRGRLSPERATASSSLYGKMTTALQAATVAASLVWVDAQGPLVLATATCGVMAGVEYWADARR